MMAGSPIGWNIIALKQVVCQPQTGAYRLDADKAGEEPSGTGSNDELL
jgi:hypothetical protein